MTKEDFKHRHPDLKLKWGRSSEDQKWWVDARGTEGQFIAAFRGRPTFEQALEELHHACQRRALDVVVAEAYSDIHTKVFSMNAKQGLESDAGCVEDEEEDD